ncbi:AfsR/SARP family transcriptional regulator [Streptomyces sp. NBC_01511]|uniref:ATP-binding protein n=1 Tax=Streptomyces sp. NBC_01511 TaxID=2903889 RepID=UPI0038691F27
MTTELRLLSEVSYRGREITGPRLHGLLALLADDPRSGRTTARLVGELWPEPEQRPEHPKKALQVLVSRARAQLGPEVVVSTPTGYRLALGEQQVDSSAVLFSAAESARHARAGDHSAALRDAEAGLAQWDGAVADGTDAADRVNGSDGSDDDPLTALRRRRAPAHHALARARALALSRLGRRTEAVDPLAAVLRAHPRDEEALLELLRCEETTAGPAQALATYDTYRRALREELGTDPGAPLRAAYQELLRAQTPVLRHGVVHDPNPLLGRDADIVAVAELLRASRVTSIVGAGGLGKTRLAHAVSHRAEQRVVHVVALAGIGTDDEVAAEVASVLGAREARRGARGGLTTAPADVLGRIVGALGPGPVLLVLDNCEHVVRGVAEMVRGLVAMARDLRVLTTSRAPLGLSSESVYLLPQLDPPTSVELFARRARAARPDAELAPDAVAEVCRRLDGLPLAVELAAARVRVMSVTEIARLLGDRFALLRGGARDAPPRHRTLHAVVEWSWNLLDPAGRAALRALSVFPDGFTAQAAHALLAPAGPQDTLRVLEDLVDQSLLRVVDTRTGARFRMLETVREFGTARLEAAGETARVTDAFLAWAYDFGTAHHSALFGADPVTTGELIKAEQDNLLRALRLALAKGDGATGVGATVAATTAVLGGLWFVESAYTRLSVLNEETARTLSHFRPRPEAVDVTRTALTVSTAYGYVTRGPGASRTLVALRRLPTAPPDTVIRATALVLATAPETPWADGPPPALRDGGGPLLTGAVNALDSFVRETRGDLAGALAAADRMLDASEPVAGPWIWLMAHARVGDLSRQSGHSERARHHYEVMLPVVERLKSWPDVFGIRWALALTDLQLGDFDGAERQLDLAMARPADSGAADGGARGGPAGDDGTAMTFGLGADEESTLALAHAVRGEIALTRGQIGTGLRLWRAAVDQVTHLRGQMMIAEHTLDVGAVGIRTAAVMAHARHGRLDLVAETAGELRYSLTKLLAAPLVRSPLSQLELPACGALLLAVATVDLANNRDDRDDQAAARRRAAARLTALAERFCFLREFQPTMSPARARRAAERADAVAYAHATAAYATLDHGDLRAAALEVLRERDAYAPGPVGGPFVLDRRTG